MINRVCGNCQKSYDVNYVPDFDGELPVYCPFCGKPVKYHRTPETKPAPEPKGGKSGKLFSADLN